MIFAKRPDVDPPFRVLTPTGDGTYSDAPAGEKRELRGLGDAIDAVTTATGIKAGWQYLTGGKCGGCEERRRRMNEMFPFKG